MPYYQRLPQLLLWDTCNDWWYISLYNFFENTLYLSDKNLLYIVFNTVYRMYKILQIAKDIHMYFNHAV